MKKFNDVIIIGVDHGYGNIKTANHCFRTGITAYDSEPLFTKDMLVYGGKFYLIGEGHKEFLPDKIKDEDYYALTLVAIAKELSAEDLTEGTVHIAAGLPLTWTAGQKESFKAYLTKNEEVAFTWQHKDYKILTEKLAEAAEKDSAGEFYRVGTGRKTIFGKGLYKIPKGNLAFKRRL